MSTEPRRVKRRLLIAAGTFTLVAGFALATPDVAEAGPDVTVWSLSGIGNYGVQDGVAGYSVGTTSCNRGDAPLNWCDQASGCAPGAGTEDHPVIAQNFYRLKAGRFSQIGMSWLKHGFVSTNSTTAGCAGSTGQSCTAPPAGGNQLGVGCTDPYGSSLNGSRPLGPRSQVDPTTGVFPFPHGNPGTTATVSDQRIKVAVADLTPGADPEPAPIYWAEGHYIASDDAAAGNSLNNASHRRITVGAAPNYTVAVTGSTVEKLPAIYAWQRQVPGVQLARVDLREAIVQRFHVARHVTDLGGGVWHYEYVVHNLNSIRGARFFGIQFPVDTNFTNAGFKDTEHHSGEPYSTADWNFDTASGLIAWQTDTHENNPNANALRWSTMFNFWFDANSPPSIFDQHTLGLFTPGEVGSLVFDFVDMFEDGFETGSRVAWDG